jgi:UDP-N-acetylmuramate-alanine ligase
MEVSFESDIVHVGEEAGIVTNDPTDHKDFYLEDEHIKLQAGRTMYRVHAYFFSRESEEARALVKRSWLSEDRLVVLDDVASADLECFFKVMYCRCVALVPYYFLS